jgi:hypothetical protein
MSTPLDLSLFGHELDAHGFAGREPAIRHLVRLARAHGVGGAAADVLADTAAPDVARFRAFAAVAARLAPLTSREPSPLAPVA